LQLLKYIPGNSIRIFKLTATQIDLLKFERFNKAGIRGIKNPPGEPKGLKV